MRTRTRRASCRWRDTEKIDGIGEESIIPTSMEQKLALLQIYPHTVGEGRDRCGRPLRIECVGRLDPAALVRQFDNDWDKVVRYHVFQSECMSKVTKATTESLGHSVYDSTVIIDLRGGSLGKLSGFPKDYRCDREGAFIVLIARAVRLVCRS
jgi:hypothetical protein